MSEEIRQCEVASCTQPVTEGNNCAEHQPGDAIRLAFAEVENWRVKGDLERFRKENDILRGIVANAKIPCVYCGLENMAECKLGFPGCAKADDMMIGDEETARRLISRIKTLETLIAGRITYNDFSRWNAEIWDEARAIVERDRKVGR
jgi:hypothetical protein